MSCKRWSKTEKTALKSVKRQDDVKSFPPEFLPPSQTVSKKSFLQIFLLHLAQIALDDTWT